MSLKYSKFNSKDYKREPTNGALARQKTGFNSIRVKTAKKEIPKIDEKFICKFDPNDKHLFKKHNARILPCGNTACTDCIKKFMDSNTGILKCNLCTNEHRILNIQFLQVDPHFVITMDKNKVSIGEDLLQQMRFFLDQLISRYDKREPFVDALFNNIQESIKSRVKQIKSEVDSLYDSFIRDLESVKANTLQSLELIGTQIKKRTSEYINFANKMNENLNAQIVDDKLYDENMMFECENKINELKDFNETFTGIFDTISFTPSTWIATPQIIGTLRPQSLNEEFNDFFKQSKALSVDLEEQQCKDPHSLCLINNQTLAVTDTHRRRICVFNSNFQLIRTIDALPASGVKRFIRPTCIYADNHDQFYLYDQGIAKLYIIDKSSLRVRKAINDTNIEDIGYCNGVLFLLDRINSATRLYTRDGRFLKQYRLYSKLVPQINDSNVGNNTRSSISTTSSLTPGFDPNHDYWLKNPVRIEININLSLIAISDSHAEIYIYDYDFRLKQVINSYLNGHNWSMIFFEKYLFTHTEDNLINCYEYASGATSPKSNDLSFIPLNRLKVNYLNFSWHMKIFNNRLVLLAEDLGHKVLFAV